MKTNTIVNKTNPLKFKDGFEYTENFDGVITIINNDITNKYYFNFKFVCEVGGSQTRTLREVYHFIKAMIFCLKTQTTKTYFINILDGQFCKIHKDKYKYINEAFSDNVELLELINKYIFIGDMHDFCNWWKLHNKKI